MMMDTALVHCADFLIRPRQFNLNSILRTISYSPNLNFLNVFAFVAHLIERQVHNLVFMSSIPRRVNYFEFL